jgi:hypothetical protein
MKRKFALTGYDTHVDFRDIIRNMVRAYLKAVEGRYKEVKFFRMP